MLPPIVMPIGLGLIALHWFMARSPRAESRRPAGDARARRRLAPVIALVVAGVVWLAIVAGLLMRC